SVGEMIPHGGCMIYSSTIFKVTSDEKGVGLILSLIIFLIKHTMTIQANPKSSSLNKKASSHFFALR
ncbi:MAG: hypothetical protein K8R75_03580, partial [Deltaproteobacteria bacterium]|nr:hypothetical protein [Deltaproteobacteria bacterium]